MPTEPSTRIATAPRYKVWPPADYIPPTTEEFAALVVLARRRTSDGFYRARWERLSDAELTRHTQLMMILPPRMDSTDQRAVYDYASEVRRELNRRKIYPRSIAVLRCESCSHATERLFEATQTTHPGLSNTSDTPIDSAWFCARCWSGDDTDD